MNNQFPFLVLERTRAQVQVDSKKRIIELLSDLLVQSDHPLDQEEVYTALLTRERLGSTALGHGIALPHSRLPQLQQPIAALVSLHNAIDFDAPDNQAVDLFYALLVPTQLDKGTVSTESLQTRYLHYLAQITAIFRQPSLVEPLRNTQAPQDLLNSMLYSCENTAYAS